MKVPIAEFAHLLLRPAQEFLLIVKTAWGNGIGHLIIIYLRNYVEHVNFRIEPLAHQFDPWRHFLGNSGELIGEKDFLDLRHGTLLHDIHPSRDDCAAGANRAFPVYPGSGSGIFRARSFMNGENTL
jgi:hypothetical protein